MSVLVPLTIVCDKCSHLNSIYVSPAPDPLYAGTILRSFHCSNWECQKPQVVRYKFTNNIPEVTQHIEPSEVFIEHEAPAGITIRPRSRSGR